MENHKESISRIVFLWGKPQRFELMEKLDSELSGSGIGSGLGRQWPVKSHRGPSPEHGMQPAGHVSSDGSKNGSD